MIRRIACTALAALIFAAPAPAQEVGFTDRSREVARDRYDDSWRNGGWRNDGRWDRGWHDGRHDRAARPVCRGVIRATGATADLTICLGRQDRVRRPTPALRRAPSLGYAGPPPTRTRPPLSDEALGDILGYAPIR